MTARRFDPRHRRATTLTELIVVLIIAVLLFVLLMKTHRPRQPGGHSMSLCLSQLRQIGIAAMMYHAENRRGFPAATVPGDTNWIEAMCYENRFLKNDEAKTLERLPVNEYDLFQCPARTRDNDAVFADYLVNAMDPAGPDEETGTWLRNQRYIDISRVENPGQHILLPEAEREEDVTDFRDVPSVATIRRQWAESITAEPESGLHALTIWKGGHLPHGQNGVNTSDDPGPRRMTRGMHIKRHRTNVAFMDSHAETLPPPPEDSTDRERYTQWLRAFGVSEPEKVAERDDDLY